MNLDVSSGTSGYTGFPSLDLSHVSPIKGKTTTTDTPTDGEQPLNKSFGHEDHQDDNTHATTPRWDLPEGYTERIKSFVARMWEKIPKCPTPDLSFVNHHLHTTWDTIQHIEWRKQITAIQEHQYVVLIINQLSGGTGNTNFALLDDIFKVVSNALSAVKRFFANYSFMQRFLQSPKLFISVLSLPFGFYSLYFSIRNFLDECPDPYEKVYRCFDLIEHSGLFFDNASRFILGLEEAAFITPRLAALVPSLTAVGIALSMTSQGPKGFLWADLNTEWSLIKNVPLPEDKITEEQDTLIKLELTRIKGKNPALLNRLFDYKDKETNKSTICTKIDWALKRIGARGFDRRADLLKTLKGRLETRSQSILLSLTTTMVSAIGLGILVFTPFTLFAHLTLLVTAIFAIKYMQSERTYKLEFAKKISSSSRKSVEPEK